MDTMKIAINSATTGVYRTENIGGREHIVTEMVPLVGDSVMKQIFYPLAEVQASFNQLDNLPAPSGHPKVDGQSLSAFHPVAMNAFNVGGFVKNPRMDGKKVICDFCLDLEVANRCDDGKELIRRIENGEEVGVSTGLNLNVINQVGMSDGKRFKFKGRNFQFDHVAVLLNEKAAGGDETRLIVNSEGDQIVICNLMASELHEMLGEALRTLRNIQDGQWLWIQDIILDDSKVVFQEEAEGESKTYTVSFTTDGESVNIGDDLAQVERKVTFEPVQKPKEMTMADELQINVENATEHLERKGFVVVGKEFKEGFDAYTENADDYQDFLENRDEFNAWRKDRDDALDAKRKTLVENSELTEEEVSGMSEDTLDKLIAGTPANANNSLRGGQGGGEEPKVEKGYVASVLSGTKED